LGSLSGKIIYEVFFYLLANLLRTDPKNPYFLDSALLSFFLGSSLVIFGYLLAGYGLTLVMDLLKVAVALILMDIVLMCLRAISSFSCC
jgi:hypothetical protein